MRAKTMGVLVVGAAFALTGCGQRSVSGFYIASGPSTVDLLQLTESKDGQLLGSLSEFGYKADGSLSQFSLSVTGTTDGHSITIVAKPNGLPFGSMNISGTFDSNTIALITDGGTQIFTVADAVDFQSQVDKLTQKATAIRIAKARQQEQEQTASRLLSESTSVEALASKLKAYAAQVEAKHDLSPFHAVHAKLLSAARHDLEIQKTLPKDSYAAGQADFRINQLAFQLIQVDFSWSNAADQGREHLQQLDQAIAGSPCHTSGDELPACVEEHEAEAAYAKAKSIVQGEDQDILSAIAQDEADMKTVARQADAFTQ